VARALAWYLPSTPVIKGEPLRKGPGPNIFPALSTTGKSKIPKKSKHRFFIGFSCLVTLKNNLGKKFIFQA
jgi:hypothetical protein